MTLRSSQPFTLRSLRQALWRALTLLALMHCTSAGVMAQRPPELTYKASFTGLAPGAGEKYIIEAFHDQDPAVQLSLDVGLQQAKVRSFVTLDEAALAEQLATHGIGVELSVTWTGAPGITRAMDVPGFPVLLDTGDPAGDHAAYELAKQAWIAAHPALYEAMQQRQQEP